MLFARQGGLLSIATQEPNLSRSPSLLGPVLLIRSGLTAAEVCAGPGPADVEHEQVGEKNANSRKFKANITSHRLFHDAKHKFKRLRKAWCMLQE